MNDVIVISGTTDSGMRYTQFWTETQKLAGSTVRFCWAHMTARDQDANLRVDGLCPDGLLDRVWETYMVFRAGGTIPPTHTADWGRGEATFKALDLDRGQG